MSGRADLLDLTTATKRNALTPEEREEFLSRKLVGRLATLREDGWPHVTPIWYVWEGGRFLLSLGNSRKHLANRRRDPHVTMCVDVDPRVEDPTKTPRSVVCFGLSELVEDEARVRAALLLVQIDRFLYFWIVNGIQFDRERALGTLTDLWLSMLGLSQM